MGLGQSLIVNRVTAMSFLTLAVVVFYLLSPLAYGNQWTKGECKRVKLLETWDFDCNTFPAKVSAQGFPTIGALWHLIIKLTLSTTQYAEYPTVEASTSVAATATPQKSPVPAQQPPPPRMAPGVGQVQKALVDGGKEQQAAGISGAPSALETDVQRVLSREERVEYRDQDGNLLDPELVKEMEGKVEFQTRYETRTRVVDAFGNEIPEPVGGWPKNMQEMPVAPPHPDVEGADKSTKLLVPDDSIPQDETVPVVESEEGIKEAEAREPRHASKQNEASSKEEEAVGEAAAKERGV